MSSTPAADELVETASSPNGHDCDDFAKALEHDVDQIISRNPLVLEILRRISKLESRDCALAN